MCPDEKQYGGVDPEMIEAAASPIKPAKPAKPAPKRPSWRDGLDDWERHELAMAEAATQRLASRKKQLPGADGHDRLLFLHKLGQLLDSKQ